MKQIFLTIVCAVMLFVSGAMMPVLANDEYDAGYQQGYTDAGNDVDQPVDGVSDDYKSGYADGQAKWHDEHDKTWGQRYDEAKEAVQTAQDAAETAQKWKGRLDAWAQDDSQ